MKAAEVEAPTAPSPPQSPPHSKHSPSSTTTKPTKRPSITRIGTNVPTAPSQSSPPWPTTPRFLTCSVLINIILAATCALLLQRYLTTTHLPFYPLSTKHFIITTTPQIIRFHDPPTFTLISLGSGGGPFESDLSGYLLKPHSQPPSTPYIAFEAGTLLTGIIRAIQSNTFPHLSSITTLAHAENLTTEGYILRKMVIAYMISHGHLDHVVGLAIASQIDVKGKKILGIPSTIDTIKTHIFNNKVWPNMGNEGAEPVIG
ncbi:hypothetical protein HK102_007244, partial [Quaeritorhiza haematococci]